MSLGFMNFTHTEKKQEREEKFTIKTKQKI